MRITGKTTTFVASCLAVVFAAGCGILYQRYDQEAQRVQELEAQLVELSKQEKQSAVMQSINAQMEEIALQERRISDEQREAAEEQTKVAERMRQNAEDERQNALEAESRAVAASEVAQKERVIAEQQRSQAEFSKRVADTLSYLTMARQLGSIATTQYQTGNKELANILAYLSYQYTNRYRGDVYNPAIYQSLVLNSQSKTQWNKHKGSVEDIAIWDNDGYRFITCSSYGEVFQHALRGNTLKTDTLFANKEFDFRDIFITRKTSTTYAVSRTGTLLINQKGQNTLVPIEGLGHPLSIEPSGQEMIILCENGLALLDVNNKIITKTRRLPYKVVTTARYDDAPILFDDKGQEHIVRSIDKIVDRKIPFKGQVTAFASSKHTGIKAYGMLDGSIYFVSPDGKAQRLAGHRSRVSRVKINGWRILSSSFDGTLNLWITDNAKIEPMPIFTTNGWLINFTFDQEKHNIWCGDQKGNLTRALISVPLMVEKLKNQLTRNLTHEEWDYYIGHNIPYEELIRKEGRR
jgi:outer membrane murein-binding lipoprotein Lpp